MKISRTAFGLFVVAVLLLIISACLRLGTSVSAQPENKKPLAAIMYHAVMKDESRRGSYVVSPEQLEADFIYIKQRGYTPVSVKQLCEYTQNGAELPEKCILITFDDGYYNNYCYAYPLIVKHGMKAVISIIGVCSEKENTTSAQSAAYSHMNSEQLKEVSESGYIEIGNHTYDMHNTAAHFGVSFPGDVSADEHEAYLKQDIARLQAFLNESCGNAPYIFAYPFGRYDEKSREIINSFGFQCTLSSEEGINYIYKGASLEMLKRYNRSGLLTTEEFFAEIFDATE